MSVCTCYRTGVAGVATEICPVHTLSYTQEELDAATQQLRQENERLRAGIKNSVTMLTRNTNCVHGEESWCCDGCKFGWETRVAQVQINLESLLTTPTPGTEEESKV